MADRRTNDLVFRYMDRISSEIVEASGNPGDRYHLGKLLLKGMRDHPDAVCQINGGTGESESNGSVLARSTLLAACMRRYGLRRGDVIIDGGTGESESNGSVLARSTLLATCMRRYGLRRGDVIALLAPNHLHVCLPFYAALYLGAIVSAVDRTLAARELKAAFEIGQPRLIFCQSEKAPEIQLVLNELNLDSQIVTFDRGDYLCSLADFMEKYADGGYSEEEFQASEFDGADTIAFIIATSGTTGLPKAAAVTHKNFAITVPYLWCKHTQFPTPTALAMIGSPLQWLTALMNFLMGPIFTYPRLQSSKHMDQHHCYELINKYRPSWTVLSPTMLTTLLKMPDRLQCDFTCFETVLLGGSAVSVDLIEELKSLTSAEVSDVFGMSELAGIGLMADGVPPPGSSGKPLSCLQYRLVSLEDGEDIDEPFTPGELWLRGPGIFKEYYRNPEATAETFSDGRWFRSGDVFYRDSCYNYFYVDRIKLMLKYRSHQISPIELENLIRSHPGVADVAVTGLPDPECGDLAVACVVRRPASTVSAQDIKDLVKDNLADSKQLRGGVIFLDEMPMTASTKVHRQKLKQMALTAPRE